MADTRKPCCLNTANLDIIENKPHVLVRRCRVCKCRHFTAFMGLTPGKTEIRAAAQQTWWQRFRAAWGF